MRESKSLALPLGYAPMYVSGADKRNAAGTDDNSGENINGGLTQAE